MQSARYRCALLRQGRVASLARDDLRDRLCPRSRRNIGEKAHFLLMYCFRIHSFTQNRILFRFLVFYKILAVMSLNSAVRLTA